MGEINIKIRSIISKILSDSYTNKWFNEFGYNYKAHELRWTQFITAST